MPVGMVFGIHTWITGMTSTQSTFNADQLWGSSYRRSTTAMLSPLSTKIIREPFQTIQPNHPAFALSAAYVVHRHAVFTSYAADSRHYLIDRYDTPLQSVRGVDNDNTSRRSFRLVPAPRVGCTLGEQSRLVPAHNMGYEELVSSRHRGIRAHYSLPGALGLQERPACPGRRQVTCARRLISSNSLSWTARSSCEYVSCLIMIGIRIGLTLATTSSERSTRRM